MKSYISYFKLKFKIGLQYRAAALAGMMTQFFFGFVYVSVYIAFYETGRDNLPMSLQDTVSYVWLGQAFFALVYLWYKDKEILNMIKSGNIAYELSRPQDLYFMWASKIMGERLSNASLRFLPVLIIALIIPKPFNLSIELSIITLILFIISMILATILMTALVLLFHVICLFTLDEKGVVNIFMIVADILSGLIIPIPFFPTYLQKISNILPFKYICDFSFRLCIGNIKVSDGIIGIFMQIIWIIILIILGRLITKKALKKAVIQGG